ncbi:hypothetical protein [Liquorilactobacillus nagelii]|uniref:hypothetical protein n=1 Tax=Liquorilactobacillus nagelii TaxID=82688 RepID=UPI0039E87D1D
MKISDVNNWPNFSMNNRVSFGGKINENYTEPFVEAYLKVKQINDENKKTRLAYIINEHGDLLVHLKSTLNKICESKHFEELFTKHKFNLSLIEKLSPQALTILKD